jgi:predicted nucleotidyltransferase
MKPSASLSKNLDRVLEAISRYPVRNPRLFGSAARGEDAETSDLDILVEPDAHTTFYDLAELEMELESILGCRVEVLTPGGLAPDVRERMMSDLRPMQ